MDPKQKIINILNQADDVISGETLSATLGISRVAVWKHIQGLVHSGIPIVASPKGYRLSRDPDSLQPWIFGTRQARIHYFPETPSTMDNAALLARQGCPDFTVVVAQRQTRGRGRLQRDWLSADGGLYFTIVIRPDIPMLLAGLVNLAAAIDMADLLRSDYQIDAKLKWPNDILVNKHKICGILSQMEAEGERVAYMNIGIGLNVNNTPVTEEPIAVSMKALLGRSIPRGNILTAFLDRFEKRMTAFDPNAVIAQWRSCNVTIGQRVRVFIINEMIEGTAVDVDAHGGLILRLADGTLKTVIVGDCFHR
jgi:BirA family biotin operon repressor/biotin-[acetyl-CoA-carboxylase] ligase